MSLTVDLRFLLSLSRDRGDRKYAWRWWRYRSPASPINAGIPWLPFAATDFLRQLDLTGGRIFEWGSGGSTLFWLSRGVQSVTSIEHDAAWHALMQQRIGARADLRLIEPVIDDSASADDPANPLAAVSADIPSSGRRFTAYVGAIDSFEDESFDVVLVDGRARPACVHHGAPKVRLGGLLIVDNADRDYYLRETMTNCLAGFSAQWFSGATPGIALRSATAIFTRNRVIACPGHQR